MRDGSWDAERLILPPIWPNPCRICRRARAVHGDECLLCRQDDECGRALPRTNYVVIGKRNTQTSLNFGGSFITLSETLPKNVESDEILLGVTGGEAGRSQPRQSQPRNIRRKQIIQHVPLANDEPLDFDGIARHSSGAPYLGVLKMDVDSLGLEINRRLQTSNWRDFTEFSVRLDAFFTATLGVELKKAPWESIYIVFAGGDDMLVVGPWNVVFDFANHVNSLFRAVFGPGTLTISAGMAIVHPKFPILRAVHAADEELERSKKYAANGRQPKDQFSAFGQTWKWEEHQGIAVSAKRLIAWVATGAIERGWLQELLALSCSRNADPLAEARINYQVIRKYPKEDDADDGKRSVRRWIDAIRRDFKPQAVLESVYLNAILRHAILATSQGGNDDAGR